MPDAGAIHEEAGDWERISLCAQRMVMAWDQTEEEEEARCLVFYSTKRQRALILKALWEQADDEWRSWARRWLINWHRKDLL